MVRRAGHYRVPCFLMPGALWSVFPAWQWICSIKSFSTEWIKSYTQLLQLNLKCNAGQGNNTRVSVMLLPHKLSIVNKRFQCILHLCNLNLQSSSGFPSLSQNSLKSLTWAEMLYTSSLPRTNFYNLVLSSFKKKKTEIYNGNTDSAHNHKYRNFIAIGSLHSIQKAKKSWSLNQIPHAFCNNGQLWDQ